MNQNDQVTGDQQAPGTTSSPLNSRKWPTALAAAGLPGVPLAAGTTGGSPIHAPSFGDSAAAAGHLAWGILGAMPGGHLGGIGIAAAGLGAWALHLKVTKPKVGLASSSGPFGSVNSAGWATRRELRRNLSSRNLLKRAAILQPSLAGQPKVDPQSLGLRIGRDMFHRRELYIACEDGLLLFAPPRAGKTALLGNGVIDAPGPVVVTTTRGDLFTTTSDLRGNVGPVYVFNGDLAGIPNTLRWNPVQGCEDPNVAVRRAGYILAGTASGSDMENGTFWTSNSFKVLRTYLMAAALGERTLMDVRGWVSHPQDPQPLEILDANSRRVPAGWARDLRQAVNAPDRTRDSIYLTLAMSFEFLSLPQVADIVQPRPGDRPFDPRAFLRSRGTLYLLGEDKPYGSIAPLFSCLTGELFTAAREMAKESEGGRLDPFLRLVLDEAAIICPLPLDRWTADGGGFGIQILVSVQSLAQLHQRWGRHGGQTIWQNLNKLVLPGLSVLEDQEMVSAMVGEREVRRVSHSQTEDGKGSHHVSTSRERIISADQVRTLDPGTGIFFHRATTATKIRFQAVWDRADVKALEKGKKKQARLDAKLAKRGVVADAIPVQVPIPPVPAYKPTVHNQPQPQQFPVQAPAVQDTIRKVS